MEDPYKDGIPVDIASTQGEMCSTGGSGGEGIGKLEDDGNPVIPTEAWNVGSPTLAKRSLSPMLGVPGNPVVTQTADPSGGVALKVATTVLQPICLGESPMVLPILAGAAGPQVAQAGTAPYLVTAQGPVSLPLVLEQQVFQQLTPQILQQAASCPTLSLPNNVLCQNPSLALAPPPPLDQKGAAPMLDQTLLTLLQNPNFAAILQDLFPSQANPSPTCHSAGSPQPDPFSTGFFPPPPLPHPYSSPLAPLVPPPTLLVPYPIVVPLPVPLPIPIPIPIPVPQAEDSKMAADPPKPVCTLSQGTQTSTKDFALTMPSPIVEAGPSVQPSPSSSCLSVAEGEVLDLSVRAPPPIQTKQEIPCQQDSVLDLSVGGVRKSCIQSCSSSNGTMDGERDRARLLGENMGAGSGAISLGVLRPVECSPKLDSKLLSGLASLEFSRQHKWVVDSAGSSSMGGTVHDATLGAGGNIEIVSTSQTAKVIVSVKDAMPAIFCGKLKGLSGVSTKNFSIKRDAGQGGYAALPRVPGDQRGGDPNDPLKKMSKNRSIKLKKVSSQEIHILPIKKQRLAAFLPRK